MSWWEFREFRGFWGILQRSLVVFMQVGAYLFWTEFAADKGVYVLNRLRIELIGLSLTLFNSPALPPGFFGAVLLPLGMVPSDFAADGAFVAVKLFGDFGDGAVASRCYKSSQIGTAPFAGVGCPNGLAVVRGEAGVFVHVHVSILLEYCKQR